MRAWLESIAGPEYASALMWTVFALIGLLVLLILIRIVRGLTFGTFVAGGRNRKARLAVMDATAVDSHRRLVLVRRDDVEHLILIGGPSDLVVEQNIRLIAHAKRPTAEDAHDTLPADRPAASAAPATPSAAPPIRQPSAPPRPAQQAPAPHAPAPAARPAHEPRFSTMPPASSAFPAARSAAPQPPSPAPRPVAAPPEPRPAPTPRPSLDDALLQELEVSLEREHKHPSPSGSKAADRTLDEEMSKLLGDLSAKR